MSQGYTLRLMRQNLDADVNRLGVKLGRTCIEAEIPVVDLAERFKVSRATIYNWFNGETDPQPSQEDAITRYISSLARRSA